MPAPENLIKSEDVAKSLDIEFVNNFTGEYDRLAEILANFTVDVRQAGAAINQYKVTGELNEAAGTDSSSGDGYVEGDLVALSKYKVTKVPIAELDPKPYRKAASAKAILSSGYTKAVLATDKKMLGHLRQKVITGFFGSLANGTGTAKGKTLQAALANVDGTLGDKLEDLGDESGNLIHFVNRSDAQAHLGDTPITIQNLFGMTYLENFLGITQCFLTNKVPSSTLYVTPAENIHAYGLDFSELATAGFEYQSDDSGLIGVYHEVDYGRVSAVTNAIMGALFVPEVTDYIVKGTIATA